MHSRRCSRGRSIATRTIGSRPRASTGPRCSTRWALGRPWSQGEISDFIRKEFADDIQKRSYQVQTAVARTSSGVRSTMPLIAHDDGPATQIDEDDDDDEFPAVDSTVTETPVAFRATRPPRTARSSPSHRSGHTAAVRNETSTSGVAIQPLPAMPQAQMLPAKSRSIVWPLLAIAMVGVAGGALFLVWKQMQQQQAPAVVNITSSSANDGSDEVPVVPRPSRWAPAARPRRRCSTRERSSPTSRGQADAAARQPVHCRAAGHRPGINKCAQEHGAPPAGVKVVIVVSTDGRAKTISLEPAGLNSTPLGTCIKNVLSATTFPKDKDEKQVSVTFKTS